MISKHYLLNYFNIENKKWGEILYMMMADFTNTNAFLNQEKMLIDI